MRRILFVANGHGENAVAARVAEAVRAASREAVGLDLFPLVGEGPARGPALVGPRRVMPSGGLVAMGNVRALARDFGAGFARLFFAQCAFLRRAGPAYDTAVAVGDVYGLSLALLVRRPTIFVGTAKSVYVAPYGPFERAILRRARRVFVRDEPTARWLRGRGVAAEAPGNVIVDLLDDAPAALPGAWLGLAPGSRNEAYTDGVRLARVARELAQLRPALGALLSLAPALDPERFRAGLCADGWSVSAVSPGDAAFEARSGRARLVAWRGSYGALLRASVALLGQAGTANEQAAAFGLPVVALGGPSGGDWYRMRQRRLLGDALLLVPPEAPQAAAALNDLLNDAPRCLAMAREGRRRMGGPGGSGAIAQAIVALSA